MSDVSIPIPASTVCTCRATDGQCHGWETGVLTPVITVNWQTPMLELPSLPVGEMLVVER